MSTVIWLDFSIHWKKIYKAVFAVVFIYLKYSNKAIIIIRENPAPHINYETISSIEGYWKCNIFLIKRSIPFKFIFSNT